MNGGKRKKNEKGKEKLLKFNVKSIKKYSNIDCYILLRFVSRKITEILLSKGETLPFVNQVNSATSVFSTTRQYEWSQVIKDRNFTPLALFIGKCLFSEKGRLYRVRVLHLLPKAKEIKRSPVEKKQQLQRRTDWSVNRNGSESTDGVLRLTLPIFSFSFSFLVSVLCFSKNGLVSSRYLLRSHYSFR